MSQEEANMDLRKILLSISHNIMCAKYSSSFSDSEGNHIEEDRILKISHSEKELEDFVDKLVYDSSTGYGLGGGIIHLKNGYWAEISQDWCEVRDILFTNVVIKSTPTIPVECMG